MRRRLVRGRRALNSELLVSDLSKARQPSRSNDELKPRTVMELDPVAVNKDGVLNKRSQSPKLAVDQSKAPDHLFGFFMRPMPSPNVLLDRGRR